MSFLLHNLLHFERLLREIGLDVHAGRALDAAVALGHIDLGRRADVHATLRSLLVHRQQDLARFDEAFRVFWRQPPDEWTTKNVAALGEQRRFGRPQVEGSYPKSPIPRDMVTRTKASFRPLALAVARQALVRALSAQGGFMRTARKEPASRFQCRAARNIFPP